MIREACLGLRLAGVGGKAGIARVVLMASGSAAASFVVLTTIGLAGVVDTQRTREAALAPQVLDATTAGDGTDVAPNAMLISDGWDGRELRRIVLAVDQPNTPVPPGTNRLPQPGEVFLSPALASLAETEPVIAGRFPQRRGPDVAADGLVEPAQLLAYVGATASDLGRLAVRVDGFGDPRAVSRLDPRAARTAGLLIALLLIAPVIMYLSVCSRLSATHRTQRLAVLRLLGLSTGRTQLVNAMETGLTALVGGIAGAAAWALWKQVVPEVRIGVFSWYSTDLALPIPLMFAVIAALAALSIAVAALASNRTLTEPLRTRRERSDRHVSPWRLLPLIAGIALVIAARARIPDTGPEFKSWLPLFGAGLIAVAIGLVLATPFVSLAAGRLMARSNRPSVLLAGNRLRHEPGATSRVLAVVAVSLFAAGIAQIVATALDRYDETNSPSIPSAVVNLQVIGPPADTSTYRSIAPLGEVLPSRRVGTAGREFGAIVATCEQLRTATNTTLPNCVNGQVLRVVTDPSGPGTHSTTAADINAALSASDLPQASGVIDVVIPFINGYFTPDVVLPPALVPTVANDFFVPIPIDSYDPQVLTAQLAQLSPAAIWNPLITQVDRLDTPRIYRGIIAAGTTAALVIGFVSLVVATVTQSLDRRRPLAHLAAIGAPVTTVRVSVALQVIAVGFTVLSAAAIAAMLGGDSYLRSTYPDAPFPFRSLSTFVSVAIAATLVAATLAGFIASRSADQVVRND